MPAVAVFVLLIPYTGLATQATVMIPLTFYALAVLLPTTVDGLRAVPEPVRQAATAMGYGPWHRLTAVELPAAVPYLVAGLRVAAVSSISLASVGALIGRGGLGYLFMDGFQRTFTTPIVAGIALTAALALAVDLLLLGARRLLAPWAVREKGRSGELALLAGRLLLLPDRRTGPNAITQRIAEHLVFSGEALLYAAVLAVPLGLLIGYTGRGTAVVTALAGATRALPTLGLVTFTVLLAGVGDTAVLVPLVALAVPPLLVAAVEGCAAPTPTSGTPRAGWG
ncbi:ABC transporter permease subunit [Kitasatospora aburaviensis]